MLPRLPLTPDERQTALAILHVYLTVDSRIAKTFAMQALTDLATLDSGLRPTVLAQLEELTRTGSPAMRSRGRKQLATLRRADGQ